MEAPQIDIQSLHHFDRQNKVKSRANNHFIKTNSVFQKILEKHKTSASNKSLSGSTFSSKTNNFENNNNSGTDIAYEREVANVKYNIIAQMMNVGFTAEQDEEAGIYEKFFQPQMIESIINRGNLELNNAEDIYKEIIKDK